MKDKKKKRAISPLPFLAAAGVWLLWALLLPLHRPWQLGVCCAFSILAAKAVSSVIKKKKPIETGTQAEPTKKQGFTAQSSSAPENEELNWVLTEGDRAMKEMGRLYAVIPKAEVKERIMRIMDVSDKIINDAKHDPRDIPRIKKFLSYYIPTTIKLLNEYDRMYAVGISGSNMDGSMARIEDMLDKVIVAYHNQLDALFAEEALDIETDIEVLETMIKREGLSDSDFKI